MLLPWDSLKWRRESKICSRTWTKTRGKVAVFNIVFSDPVHNFLRRWGSELMQETSTFCIRWSKEMFLSNVEFWSPRVVIFVFFLIGFCVIIITCKIRGTACESRPAYWVKLQAPHPFTRLVIGNGRLYIFLQSSPQSWRKSCSPAASYFLALQQLLYFIQDLDHDAQKVFVTVMIIMEYQDYNNFLSLNIDDDINFRDSFFFCFSESPFNP